MSQARAKLILVKDNLQIKEFMINSDITNIGRWDADSGAFPDIDLANDDVDSKISRKHAKIISKNGQFFLEDYGSLNGSYINRGKRLRAGDPEPIKDGDELLFGKTFFKFAIVDNN
ncbi:MAG: FHA domain-containing protein [Candidatus Sericytochromatia bacterium]|nr:FHA domain-containing protein [Candidatus Sericytochromatia bacterium]